MKIFISGGCKNGKSYHAQRLAKAQQTDLLYYIATMKPADPEDDGRIIRHKKERGGWGFETIEQPVDIENILDKCDCRGSFLLDSLTAVLANEMFPPPDYTININAAGKIKDGLSRVMDKIKNIVIVSDYIYGDAAAYDETTEKYRRSLAEIDRFAAQNCDIVLEAAYTNVTAHKGGELYEKIL